MKGSCLKEETSGERQHSISGAPKKSIPHVSLYCERKMLFFLNATYKLEDNIDLYKNGIMPRDQIEKCD